MIKNESQANKEAAARLAKLVQDYRKKRSEVLIKVKSLEVWAKVVSEKVGIPLPL